MRLLECQQTLAHQERNKPDSRLCTLSKFLNIAGIFLIVFSSRHCLYIRGRFLSNAGMCFDGVVVAVDTVLSLKGKILLGINKSWVQNFPRYESKM